MSIAPITTTAGDLSLFCKVLNANDLNTIRLNGYTVPPFFSYDLPNEVFTCPGQPNITATVSMYRYAQGISIVTFRFINQAITTVGAASKLWLSTNLVPSTYSSPNAFFQPATIEFVGLSSSQNLAQVGIQGGSGNQFAINLDSSVPAGGIKFLNASMIYYSQ